MHSSISSMLTVDNPKAEFRGQQQKYIYICAIMMRVGYEMSRKLEIEGKTRLWMFGFQFRAFTVFKQ